MSEKPFDWDDLRLFLSVARHGGLAAASTETGKSAPTLGRRMFALEKSLGKDLFIRLPQGYSLTDHGNELLSSVVALEAGIQPVLKNANSRTLPRVKISAGTWVTHHLCNQLTQSVIKEPLTLQFISADHLLDIAHREAVIGIRNAKPTQVGLAGQAISQIQFAVYAVHPDITHWTRVIGNTPSARWVETQLGHPNCIEVSEPRNALDLTLAGLTRTVLPTFIGDIQKTLIRVSGEIPELRHQQWLVSHHEDRHRPEVRTAISWLQDVLANNDALR